MAFLNRDEVSAAIQAVAAIVDETSYKETLDDDFAQSVLFRKDVSASVAAAGSTKTLEFLDVDYIEVTQSTDVAYTLNGVQQGEIKYLKITKGAGDTITFANADDQTANSDNIDEGTTVLYRIINKDGTNILVESITQSQQLAKINSIIVEAGSWDLSADTEFDFDIATIGIDDYTKILSIKFTIQPDRNYSTGEFRNLDFEDFGGTITQGDFAEAQPTSVPPDTIRLDSTAFTGSTAFYNETTTNRGWLIIELLP